MNILTFDVEDWFHLLDFDLTKSVDSWNQFESRIDEGMERILGLLGETNSGQATFFCLGWVAEHYPHIIRQIHDGGHHIATHSYAHQLVYEQSESEFTEDLRRSIGAIGDITGESVDCYRAPGFSITQESMWVFDVLCNEGIKIDCSLFPASRAHGGLPGFGEARPILVGTRNGSIRALPINTRRFLGRDLIYSGGGYFRVLPEAFLRRWFRHDPYVMTYFHPRDFDPGQPILPGLTRARRFRTYVGLGTSLKKLRSILSENTFISAKQADEQVDWQSVPTYQSGI